MTFGPPRKAFLDNCLCLVDAPSSRSRVSYNRDPPALIVLGQGGHPSLFREANEPQGDRKLRKCVLLSDGGWPGPVGQGLVLHGDPGSTVAGETGWPLNPLGSTLILVSQKPKVA